MLRFTAILLWLECLPCTSCPAPLAFAMVHDFPEQTDNFKTNQRAYMPSLESIALIGTLSIYVLGEIDSPIHAGDVELKPISAVALHM